MISEGPVKLNRSNAASLCEVIEKRILEATETTCGIRNLLDYLDGLNAPLSSGKQSIPANNNQPNIQDKLEEFNGKLAEHNDLLYSIQARLKTFLGKE